MATPRETDPDEPDAALVGKVALVFTAAAAVAFVTGLIAIAAWWVGCQPYGTWIVEPGFRGPAICDHLPG